MSIIVPNILSNITSEFPDQEIEVWDYSPESINAPSKDRCTFYVPTYMSGRRAIEVSKEMPNLEVIQLLTAGVDGVRSLMAENVTLCNAKGVHDASTAELTVALALNARRGLANFHKNQLSQLWISESYPSLADSKVLIVGYGSIGRAVEQRLLPFEVEITRVSRKKHDDTHPMEDLPGLLGDADIVILLVPLTSETRGFFNDKMFSAMKDGAILINVARGQVVDTDDLVNALKSRNIFAALDVVDPEPLPIDHVLWQLDNCIITPHVGGNSTAFFRRAHRLVVSNLKRYIQGHPLLNVISGEY